jgi:hypothetical protein
VLVEAYWAVVARVVDASARPARMLPAARARSHRFPTTWPRACDSKLSPGVRRLRTPERGLDLPGGSDQVHRGRFGDCQARLGRNLVDERIELAAARGLPAQGQLTRGALDLDLQAVLDALVEPERSHGGVEIRELLLRWSTVERVAGIANPVTTRSAWAGFPTSGQLSAASGTPSTSVSATTETACQSASRSELEWFVRFSSAEPSAFIT